MDKKDTGSAYYAIFRHMQNIDFNLSLILTVKCQKGLSAYKKYTLIHVAHSGLQLSFCLAFCCSLETLVQLLYRRFRVLYNQINSNFIRITDMSDKLCQSVAEMLWIPNYYTTTVWQRLRMFDIWFDLLTTTVHC